MFEVFRFYKRVFEDKRVLVVIGVTSGLFSFLMFFSERFSMGVESVLNLGYVNSLPFVLLLATVSSFALLYLQSGRGGNDRVDSDQSVKVLAVELGKLQYHTEEKISELRDELRSFEQAYELSPDDKVDVMESIVQKSTYEVVANIFDREIDKLKSQLASDVVLDKLISSTNDIVHRLRREIDDLRLRSNINLLIGMSITAGGLYLLWNTVSMVDASVLLKELASEGQESNAKFLKNLILPIIPRMLLIIFVEVFAYFFLRLYKVGLSEIKYFQNELTNVESKLAALQFSYVTKNEECLKVAVESLSRTERNFVLEKGQTTVELERAKSESELTRNIIKTIPSFFEQNKK